MKMEEGSHPALQLRLRYVFLDLLGIRSDFYVGAGPKYGADSLCHETIFPLGDIN